MIILQMCGGLGNQMFQYAMYLKLKSLGKNVKFDDVTSYELSNARPIQLAVFGIDFSRASREEITEMRDSSMALKDRVRRKLHGRNLKQYIEANYCYDPHVYDLDDTYLIGYFQSDKYFSDIANQIRDTYTFDDSYITDLARETEAAIVKEPNAVSIHVRRGDYASLDAGDLYTDICTDEYYEAAIEYVLNRYPDARFYLFTNDHTWAEFFVNIHPNAKITVVKGSTEYTGYLDMYLMSKCRHHIIANSSFSWWGAWLSNDDGLTIAPCPWLNSEYCSDIHTDAMVKINPNGEIVE